MVAANREILFTLAFMTLIIRALAMDTPATPPTDLSSLTATPDASGMASTPAPDLSGMAPTSTPGATPAPDASGATTPTTSEIQPEQMKGDGILELSEEKPAELLPSGNAQIGSLANQAKSVADDLSKTIDQIKQQHAQLQGQLGQIQSELDAFYQTSGAQRGKIGEILDEVVQPLIMQPAPPTIATPNTGIPLAPVAPTAMPGMIIPPM
ncbi:hypothetical protein JST56_04030 [Candidatus Dependentiae bacterium]|nr:hypothetical protein [Candidatus Dependentiae bacterium]